MRDAKPRMLTNLDWLNSRDDLRLLRSIKFGVSGTSMGPWGDQTTMLQRLQLVMYIRSLTAEQEKRSRLQQALYDTFAPLQSHVEQMRLLHYPKIAELQAMIAKAEALLQRPQQEIEQAVEAYKGKLTWSGMLDVQKSEDQLWLDLQKSLAQEKKIYEMIGLSLIGRLISDETFEKYLQLVSRRAAQLIQEQIVPDVEAQIAELEKKVLIEEGKIASLERNQEMVRLRAEVSGYQNLKNSLLAGMKEASALRLKQEDLMKGALRG